MIIMYLTTTHTNWALQHFTSLLQNFNLIWKGYCFFSHVLYLSVFSASTNYFRVLKQKYNMVFKLKCFKKCQTPLSCICIIIFCWITENTDMNTHQRTAIPTNMTLKQVSLKFPTITITPPLMYINHKLQYHKLLLKMFWFLPYCWVRIYIYM